MHRNEELLPFSLEIRPGQPVFEQLAYAVRKAVVSGLIKTGDRFPSVRTISRELRIHPNTVQKAITVLVNEGLLDVHPGIGTVVSKRNPSLTEEGLSELKENLERLVVEARKAGMQLEDLQKQLTEQWNQLSNR